MNHIIILMFIPLGLPMSFWAYVSPFAWVRTLPLAVALLGMLFLRKKNPTAVVKLGWWAFFTYVADAMAWLILKREIPEGSGTMTWASGVPTEYLAGFPLHLLEVPPGAMGSDRPELSQWWIVFANLAFWALCVAALVFVPRLSERWGVAAFLKRRKNGLWPWAGAFVVHQFTLFMFMIWFD